MALSIFLLLFAVCAFALCGLLLWLRRAEADRARLLLGATWFFLGFSVAAWIVVCKMMEHPLASSALSPVGLYIYLLVTIAFFLYPIEVLKPSWFTLKKLVLFIGPPVLLGALIVGLQPSFSNLDSFEEICRRIGEFEVWSRLVVLFLCIVPYGTILFFIPYVWMRKDAINRLVLRYVLLIQPVSFLYYGVVLTGSEALSNIHMILLICFGLFVTYQELYMRFPAVAAQSALPQNEESLETEQAAFESEESFGFVAAEPVLEDAAREDISPALACQNPKEESGLAGVREGGSSKGDAVQSVLDPLMVKLEHLMDAKQIWRDPEMDLTGLAKLLHTNRTKIGQMMQEAGYESCREYLNRRRIMEFVKRFEADPGLNVEDTFAEVGFRSKTTALRYFRKYTGTVPSLYFRSSAAE